MQSKEIRYSLLNAIRDSSYEQRRILPLIYGLVNWKHFVPRRRLVNQFRSSQYPEIPRDVGYLCPELTNVSIIEEVIRDAEQKVKHPNNKKTILGIYDPLHYDCLEQTSLSLDSPYLRFCLQDQIIGIVSRYFREIPVLTHIGVWNSTPMFFEGNEYSETQLFHCDADMNTQIKIFLCVNNVASKNGPLCLLDASQSKIARRKLRYRANSPGYRVTDGEMKNVLPNYSISQCIGDKGTVFFADTSKCFHYGARIKDRELSRVLVWFNFIPITQTYVPRKKPTYPFLSLISPNLSETQKLVLGGD